MTNASGAYDPNAVATYLAAVASAAPTPGGGSVAAVVGALGAALGEMVCNLSIGRAGVADSDDRLTRSRAALVRGRDELLRLAADDERAYAAYRAAADLPREAAEEKSTRRAAMQEALLGAAKVPLATAETTNGLLDELENVARLGNPHVLSDACVAAILAEAAVRCAAVNVRVNTSLLRDRATAEHLDRRIEVLEAEAREAEFRVRRTAAKRD